ncbi:diguanylate cyclase [Thiomicrorhabdus cannonii]|uniref:diguanylate cyclase n=1 Tax=Thiomicrorhabdus cannonii TaxID=2748011 RepID=UPI0015BAD556|nr:diguanylate cyclase [Thiomicrorhabdus cannonii]
MSDTMSLEKRLHSRDVSSRSEMVQSLDARGKVLAVSPKWLEVSGYAEDEVVGHFFGDFLAAESLSQMERNFPHLKDYGFVDNVPLVIKKKDGTLFEAVLNGTSIYDAHGRFQKTFCELRTLEYYMHSYEETEALLAKERFLSTLNNLRANISRLLIEPCGEECFLQSAAQMLEEPAEVLSVSLRPEVRCTNDADYPIEMQHQLLETLAGSKVQTYHVKVLMHDPFDKAACYAFDLALLIHSEMLVLWEKGLHDLFVLIHAGLRHLLQSERLHRTQNQLASLANNVNAIGFEWDKKRQAFAFVSPRSKALLGYEPEQWQSLDSWLQWVHPEDRESVAAIFEEDDVEQCPEKMEFRLHTASGVYLWVLCHIGYETRNQRIEKVQGVLIDNTEQKQIQCSLEEAIRRAQELTEAQHSLLTLFDRGDIVLFKWKNNLNWGVDYVSASIERLLGYEVDAFSEHGITYASLVHPDDLLRVGSEVQEAIEMRQSFFKHQPYRLLTRDNQVKWVADTTYVIRNEYNEITHFLGYVFDVTFEREAQQRLQSMIDLQENIVIVTDGHQIRYANQQFNSFFGVSGLQDFMRRYNCICDRFINADGHYAKQTENEQWMQALERLPVEKRIVRMESHIGEQASFLVKRAALDDATYIVTFSDITATLQERDFYQYLAQHDRLTGAQNREYLYHKFDKFAAAAKRTNRCLALILFDIDHFKQVNDVYGHNAGDDVLKAVVQLVKQRIRVHDTLIRWGGEEFIVLAEVDMPQSAQALAEHLRYEIEQAGFKEVGRITSSFGVALVKDHEPLKNAVSRADKALYTAKNAGRNLVELAEEA